MPIVFFCWQVKDYLIQARDAFARETKRGLAVANPLNILDMMVGLP
jgi:hypothetical protein